MAVPEEGHLFLQRIDGLAHAVEPPPAQVEQVGKFLLALLLEHLAADGLFTGLVGGGRAGHGGVADPVAQGEVIGRLRPVGGRGGGGVGGAVDEVAHAGGHAGAGEAVDVRGRAAEPGAVEQVGGFVGVPLGGGKRREHLDGY